MQTRLLRWRLSELEQQTGDALISLFISPDTTVEDALEALESAASGADETKPASNARAAVREYDAIPATGVAVFADVTEAVVFDTELSPPIAETTVTVSSRFDTAPLDVQQRTPAPIGLVIIERGDALVGLLQDKRIRRLKRKTGYVPSQHDAGGQSQQRFERRIEGQKQAFFDRVIDRMRQDFLNEDGSPAIEGLVIGGASETAQEFAQGLPTVFDERLVDVISMDVDDSLSVGSLRQLYAGAQSAVNEFQRAAEYELVEAYQAALGSGERPVATTASEVEQALEYRAVDTLLCTDTHSYATLREAQQAVEEQGGAFVFVEQDWEGGVWLAETTDGCGAMLRYEISS